METQIAYFELYLIGYEIPALAKIFNISPRTLYDWAKDNNWEAKRTQRNNSIRSSEERILKMIDYETLCIEKHIQQNTDNQEFEHIKSGNIDALNKLLAAFKAITTRESKAVYFYISNKYLDWLLQQGFENAAEHAKIFREFLQERIQNLKK